MHKLVLIAHLALSFLRNKLPCLTWQDFKETQGQGMETDCLGNRTSPSKIMNYQTHADIAFQRGIHTAGHMLPHKKI